MCKLCACPDLLSRLERQIKALDGGGNFKPDTVRDLLADSQSMLTSLYQAHTASRLILQSDGAVLELVSLGDTPPPGGLH